MREGALLRDEIIALRGKIADLTAEKDLLRAQHEAEKGKGRELEDLLQVITITITITIIITITRDTCCQGARASAAAE